MSEKKSAAAERLAAQRQELEEKNNEKWYVQTFARPLNNKMDYYRQGRLQFTKSQFDLARKCLEIYISVSSNVDSTALHLLGNCHRNLKNPQRAFECFLGCVRLGEEVDWQPCVESLLDMDTKEEERKLAVRRRKERKQFYREIVQKERDIAYEKKMARRAARLNEAKEMETQQQQGKDNEVGETKEAKGKQTQEEGERKEGSGEESAEEGNVAMDGEEIKDDEVQNRNRIGTGVNGDVEKRIELDRQEEAKESKRHELDVKRYDGVN